MEEQLAKGPLDLPFLMLVCMLTGVGLIMMFSASFASALYNSSDAVRNNPWYYIQRQAVFAAIGLVGMYIVSRMNYEYFRILAIPALVFSIVLLVLVIIPGNPVALTRNHATRWLGIRNTSFQFQPSEVAKMAVVLYFSDTISKKKDKMNTTRYGVAPYLLILGVLSVLMMLEPHLSGTVLILGAGAVLMLVGGINWAWVFGALGGAAGMLYFALFVVGYNTSRIQYWLNPWADQIRPVPSGHVAESLAGLPGRWLPAGAEPALHRLRRPVGRGSGQEPSEI